MKVSKFQTLSGLDRVLNKTYHYSFEKAILLDDDGLYCISFSNKSFPSANKDRILCRIAPYQKNIGDFIDDDEKKIILKKKKIRLF